MSDDEVLAFEISDRDLADSSRADFRFLNRRRSKNKEIYGIWAANSDEDGDEVDGFRPSFGGGRRDKKSYTTPVGFVSAGIQGQDGGKKDTEGDVEGEDFDHDDNEGNDHESVSDDDESFSSIMRSKYAQKKTTGMKKRKMEPRDSSMTEGQIAGLRSSSGFQRPNVDLGRGFGDWEKHTKGIGAKILLKVYLSTSFMCNDLQYLMGYEAGKGLGKNLQGRSTIVEAHLRKGRGAIGAYGKEKSAPSERKKDSSSESDAEFKSKLQQWKKKGSSSGASRTKDKPSYVYKSVDEVLEEGKWRGPSLATTDDKRSSNISMGKVIDMTGREERVLSGYHAIAMGTNKRLPVEDSNDASKVVFEMPELIHNINLLKDKCEEDMISEDRNLRHHRDRIEILKREEASLSCVVEREAKEIERLKSLMEYVEQLETSKTLDDAQKLVKSLRDQFDAEFSGLNLAQVTAQMVVAPMLKDQLQDWDPIIEPEKNLTTFMLWQKMLCGANENGKDVTDPSHPLYLLIWEAWMPSLRRAVISWNPREPEALIHLLDVWTAVVPAVIMRNVCSLNVLPRLQAAVDQWQPQSDPSPIHTWLHPWLPLLPTQLSLVYPTIRQKLAAVLAAWHPSDSSALAAIRPWVKVFDGPNLATFLQKNIVAKLEACLRYELVINPSQQNMQPWNWVARWSELMPQQLMVPLIASAFFQQWMQVLLNWLNQSPLYTDVIQWYEGWKQEIRALGIIENAEICTFFRQALIIMERAVSKGGPMAGQQGAVEAVKYLHNKEVHILFSAKTPTPTTTATTTSKATPSSTTPSSSLTFKELLMERCAARGIKFMPVMNRYEDGRQVYRCGNVLAYLDNNVVFVFKNALWQPVSMQELFNQAWNTQ